MFEKVWKYFLQIWNITCSVKNSEKKYLISDFLKNMKDIWSRNIGKPILIFTSKNEFEDMIPNGV